IYDGWLALVAAVTNRIQIRDSYLKLYRTHPSQQVGNRPPTDGREPVGLGSRFNRPRHLKLDPLRHKADQLRTLLDLLAPRVPADASGLAQLHRRWQHHRMRSTLPDDRLRRPGRVLSDLADGAYHRYADEWASWTAPYLAALGDILE
ncbi:MAG: glycosyltransferase family 2 protein, partial [Bacteroidetes bacterium]|nr:glycosyltransferase family 2 protein [Fibrella sp.]